MRAWKFRVTLVMLASTILQTLAVTPAPADHFFGRLWRLEEEKWYDGKEPANMCSDDAIQELAMNIDWLEHHIDTYGSIVAKQPDIWGEARMTKHRDEYERMMFEQLNQFKYSINAAIRQEDSSFLAQAFALSSAVDGQTPADTATTVEVDTKAVTSTNAEVTAGTVSAPDITPDSNDIKLPDDGEIGLEPTLFLDQMSRYLQHLHELRRINEGDDTSDSPGYAMNLVRIPVSALPGKLTREGWGAEITVTGTPVLSDDLLPNTFRNLIVNDLVDQLGLPMVKTAENVRLLTEWRSRRRAAATLSELIKNVNRWHFSDSDIDREEVRILVDSIVTPHVTESIVEAFNVALDDDVDSNSTLSLMLEDDSLRSSQRLNAAPGAYAWAQFAEFLISLARHSNTRKQDDIENAKVALVEAIIAKGSAAESDFTQQDFEALQDIFSRASIVAARTTERMKEATTSSAVTVSGRARRASQPVPPSQVADVYGFNLFYTAADFFCPAYRGRQIRWNGTPYCSVVDAAGKDVEAPDEFRVDLLDVQKWLQAELSNAHEMLSQPNHLALWYDLANPQSGLAVAIRSNHLEGAPVEPWRISASAAVSPASHPAGLTTPEYVRPPQAELTELPPPATYAIGMAAAELGANNSVQKYRDYFFRELHRLHFTPAKQGASANLPHIEVLEHLAWAIVVESALLNERLNEDVRKAATAKGCGCLAAIDQDLTFFLPEVAAKPESGLSEQYFTATRVFQDYVRCRWPIHVFALDPREQDQNVADASARRRELQFALALGFVTGEISANSLTNYSRELETQVETISLNRTAVGFAHGNDTFGWRFYPRVQALDVPGAAGTIWQSIQGTPRDHDVRKRQLEPGMRECVAIVLMPSFVPYVDFDVRSNWFRLTNPKNAAITMKDTMKLSRGIAAMRNSQALCVQCAHCYREGEVERLMRRVDQLDRELPLQSMRTMVPYENTLGGFEMFNTGITDLAPQLIGWYGAPGVVLSSDPTNPFACGCAAGCAYPESGDVTKIADLETRVAALEQVPPTKVPYARPPAICEGKGTTLFLVGDHLSVHDTKIIAGGVCIPDVRLVSRQIMRVTIPSCVQTVNVDGKDYVAVYAATPYGVTNHLHVPVVNLPEAEEQEAMSEQLGQLEAEIEILQAATPLLLSADSLDFDADCDPASTSAVRFISKMPAEIDVTLTPAASPQLGTSYLLGVRYHGVFNSTPFPVTLTADNPARGKFRMTLDDPVEQSMLAALAAAVPSITTTSFKDGKDEALAQLFYVDVNGQVSPIGGDIKIDISLTCNCCDSAVKAAATAASPPSASEPATGSEPPASPSPPRAPAAGSLPVPAENINPASAVTPGCNCTQAAASPLAR